MKILVDAFGGDNSPEEVVKGTVECVNENSGFIAVLVGKEQVIKDLLVKNGYNGDRIEILNAEDVISCEEEPTVAIRRKVNSTINVAFKELKENSEAKAFVSAGSTGAVLVGATLKLGRINGVNRPALCPILPTEKEGKSVILLDAGANADCKEINLCQFAVMGSVYAKILGVENPKVALLSNGTEDEKGNALNHAVFPLLKQIEGINFVGNIEARDILSGDIDVVVTDGFSGNVALKSIEGSAKLVLGFIKDSLYSSLKTKIAGLLLKNSIKKVYGQLDYTNKGGALFIGVDKVVVKAHGSSKAKSIKGALLQAVSYVNSGLIDSLKEELVKINVSAEN